MSKEIQYQDQGQYFIQDWLSRRTGRVIKIYNEGHSRDLDDVLQAHPWVIRGSLPEYDIVGLRQALIEFNRTCIEEAKHQYKLSESFDQIIDAMVKDFEDRFDRASNGYEVYPLVFSRNDQLSKPRQIELKRPSGQSVCLQYNVIHYEWMNQKSYEGRNHFSIIREKRIPVSNELGKTSQRPDFAVYINGIPLMFIEYKTEDSGISRAVEDLENKSTYRKVPFFMASNSRECTLVCNIEQFNVKVGNGLSAYRWTGYNRTPETKNFTETECFYHEILTNHEHLYFYVTQTTSVDTRRKVLKNARVQQYFATREFHRRLQHVRSSFALTSQRTPFNYGVLHTQRSGKTMTMKYMAQHVLDHFYDIFQHIFVFAPDLQIKKVLTDELNNRGQQSKIQVHTIGGPGGMKFEDAIRQMNRNVTSNHGGLSIYIVNMQQVNEEDGSSKVKPCHGYNVLNIIDEGHFGQAGELAQRRLKWLPNASNLLFTATPKTATYASYLGVGDVAESNILDRFSYTQARQADIVVNVLYLKPKHYIDAFSQEKFKVFADLVEDKISRKFNNVADAYDGLSCMDDESDASGRNKVRNQAATALLQQLHEDLLPSKIEHICDFQLEIRNTLVFDKKQLFYPKAIVYSKDIAQARAFIQAIRALNGSKGNVYRDLRFALDYASLDNDTCLQENDGISLETLETNFRAQESSQRIDVLVAVNKYQKGYDLPELTTVFLDRNFQEPSALNQIYTRPATKAPHKTIGYCVDLSLGTINQHTFKESVRLYDSEDNDSGDFLNEEAIALIESDVRQVLSTLKKTLVLRDDNFLKEHILNAVLNPTDASLASTRQSTFFKESKKLFKHIENLKSPIFFKAFKKDILSLHESFIEFKEIYADVTHRDHHKIKISLDDTTNDSYLTKDEIKTIIQDVLQTMSEKSLSTLLDFDYGDVKELFEQENPTAAEWVQKKKQEEHKNQLAKAFKLMSSLLEEKDISLYEQIKKILDAISDDRSLVYKSSTQEEIAKLLALSHQTLVQFNQLLQSNFDNNPFIYYVVEGLMQAFPKLERSEMHDYFLFIARTLEPVYTQSVRRLDTSLTTYEQIQTVYKQIISDQSHQLPAFCPNAFLMLYMDTGDKNTFIQWLVDNLQVHGYGQLFKSELIKDKILKEAITQTSKFKGYLG